MEISILHLSDIHLTSKSKNVVLNRISKIFDAVKNDIRGKEAVFILTSGDIAFSGKSEEYAIAKKMYNDLSNLIEEYCNLQTLFVFVPGNHDCIFDEAKESVRLIILQNFSQHGFGAINQHVIDLCCEPQTNYFEFVRPKKNKSDVVLDTKLLKIETFKIGDYIIKFNCFNSSWHSTMREQIGSMGFPIEYFEDSIPNIENAISISVVHHPLNWQTPANSKPFREMLAKMSDIVVSGHEHNSRNTVFSDLNHEYQTIHVEAGALQETSLVHVSEFNLINFDLTSSTITINPFKYHTEGFYERRKQETVKLEKAKKLKSKPFQLRSEYLADLENPGANFIHSGVDEVKLSDIYIPPTLNDITITRERKSSLIKHVNSAEVFHLDENTESLKKVIYGADSAGKTAMLKHVYKKYYQNGFYPIYISGSQISDVALEKFKKYVLKEFAQQYQELDGRVNELDLTKVVLLVDDLHKYKFSSGKPVLMNSINKLFRFVIVTGDDLMQMDSFTDNNEQIIDPFDSFDRYVIAEFGPALRNDIITKWYRLGKDYLDNGEKNEFLRVIDAAHANITSIIGKNLIPAYPIYILSILQAMETGQQESTQNNLHAYYYEMLIKSSLKKALDDPENMGFYLGLCREYFYFLFSEKIRFSPITPADFQVFLRHHETKYGLNTQNVDTVLSVLKKGRIVKDKKDNNVAVSYKYVYYYFVAKHLSDHIDSTEVRETIEKMADRMYRDEYSNIILFLTHLSKNPFIIEKLLEKAKTLYKETPVLKLEEDVDFINKLQQTLPELVYHNIDVEDARREDLHEKEALEQIESQFEDDRKEDTDYDLNEDLNSINVVAHLTKAMRTISILGLVTKKNWGELLGDEKFRLAEETLCLGLRTLNSHFLMINNSQVEIVDHVKTIIHKRFIKERLKKEDIQNITKNYIFMLCSSSLFGLFKNIINSIGTEKLSRTFDEVVERHPYNSFKLAKLGIQLDHYRGFPISTIEQMKKENEKNPLGLSNIQNLVIDYLYMYDVPIEQKQQICELLNIKIQHQRAISGTSKVKKIR